VPVEWIRGVLIAVPKNGDLVECSNYRTIALLNHPSKVLMMMLLETLKQQMEPYLAEEQAGLRNTATELQIVILRPRRLRI